MSQPFNKYYPPDYQPVQKKASTVRTIRFEMPFNIWCDGCKNHVGMGVRFNAEKRQIGFYLSTPILSFRMKCHLCTTYFVIHSDPKNADYKVIEGAREQILNLQPEKKLLDPLQALEQDLGNKKKAESELFNLQSLKQVRDSQWKDSYSANQKLRAKFRKERKLRNEKLKNAKLLQEKIGTHIPMLDESQQDAIEASRVMELKWKKIKSW